MDINVHRGSIEAGFTRFITENAMARAYLAEHGAEGRSKLRAQYEAGFVKGAHEERERIRAIDNLLTANCVEARRGEWSTVLQMMKWDPKCTAEDVALVLAPAQGNLTPEAARTAAAKLWDAVPAVRAGHDSKEGFVALKDAEARGQVKSISAARGMYRATLQDYKRSLGE